MVSIKWVPPKYQQLEGSLLSEKLILCILSFFTWSLNLWSSWNLLVAVTFLEGLQNQKFMFKIDILIFFLFVFSEWWMKKSFSLLCVSCLFE